MISIIYLRLRDICAHEMTNFDSEEVGHYSSQLASHYSRLLAKPRFNYSTSTLIIRNFNIPSFGQSSVLQDIKNTVSWYKNIDMHVTYILVYNI